MLLNLKNNKIVNSNIKIQVQTHTKGKSKTLRKDFSEALLRRLNHETTKFSAKKMKNPKQAKNQKRVSKLTLPFFMRIREAYSFHFKSVNENLIKRFYPNLVA